MHVVYPYCCGLDVHKRSVTACLLRSEASDRSHPEIRRFGTMTRDLLELADWLQSHNVTHVAMESTGVYWKPVWNILGARPTSRIVSGLLSCSSTDCYAGVSCHPPRSGSCGI